MVSYDIADAGKYDMIIPFGWWYQEHPIRNIETPSRWRFEHANCINHVEDEGIADMFEYHDPIDRGYISYVIWVCYCLFYVWRF